ncbi:hypothetical protein [Hyphomonas jannaschiana]|uniref:Uncharacterized protein n=1 Tax=Hyphomonas jannaschiana VP2 TaxID=1280952 RepID=A0A059FCT5_9PROT|nr:hypothetical protein [Hyphomonas jannaschiana]KCZ88429.1 hypothetical protein HJA_08679 [Hyphomonas jannaschiana VP2]
MDRQTLDMEGARQGEISAASLQMGDDTIAIQRIATMTVEANDFFPWDTPKNRVTQKGYATAFVSLMFFALMGIGWWAVLPGRPSSMVMLGIGVVMLIGAMICGLRAGMIAAKLRVKQKYFRLVIGTSDARQIPLVDDNRDVLCKIRDVVRHKMDTDDRTITGDFDLNLDIVNLKSPNDPDPEPPRGRSAAAPQRAGEPESKPLPELDEADDDPPLPKLARRHDDDHQDALFDKVAEAMKPAS